MPLYELRGYRTGHYDRGSDKQARFREMSWRDRRPRDWIAGFLNEFPDGKVIVSVIGKSKHLGREKSEKLVACTASGWAYLGRYKAYA